MKYGMLILLCISLVLEGLTQSINLEKPNVEHAGFSAGRLNRLDSFMQQQVQNGRMAGGAALILRNGHTAYYQSWGYNDEARKSSLPKDAIFRIASQTKAITSVGIMLLYEEGKLLLSDPVEKYIPEFKDQQVIQSFRLSDTTFTAVPAKRKVTIHDLLTHSSGIGYPYIGSPEAIALYHKHAIPAGIGMKEENLAVAMKTLGKLPLFHQPGEKWTYGLNTDLLGYLIELISGQTLDAFFRTRIFEPLGMRDTYFNLPKEKHSRLATLFIPDETGRLKPFDSSDWELDGNFPMGNSRYYSGGAGLSSTLKDYGIFLQMLLNQGEYNGVRLLSRNSVRMMTSNQIGALSLGNSKFGLGFSIVTEADAAKDPWQVGTYGWGGAFATTYWVDPKENMVVLFFRQVWGDRDREINEKFKVLTYQAIND